jgi:hypothetical protein
MNTIDYHKIDVSRINDAISHVCTVLVGSGIQVASSPSVYYTDTTSTISQSFSSGGDKSGLYYKVVLNPHTLPFKRILTPQNISFIFDYVEQEEFEEDRINEPQIGFCLVDDVNELYIKF